MDKIAENHEIRYPKTTIEINHKRVKLSAATA